MLVAPVAVVADADVTRGPMGRRAALDGNRQGERARRTGDDATVAVGLLHIVVVTLLRDSVGGKKFCIVLNRSQVG